MTIRARRGVRVSGEDRPYGTVVCPLCGCGLNWNCSAGPPGGLPVVDLPSPHRGVGQVHCQNGRNVSRMADPKADRCTWPGADVIRRADGEVIITKLLPGPKYPQPPERKWINL